MKLKEFKVAKFICFCNIQQQVVDNNDWLKKKEKAYSLSLEKVLKSGYVNSNFIGYKFDCFIEKFLKKYNFKSVEKYVRLKHKSGIINLYFVINNGNNKTIIECRSYRSISVEPTIINQSVKHISDYRKIWKDKYNEEVETILIVSCHISNKLKESYYNEKKVLIIDIANLLYLLRKDNQMLKELIEVIPYNTNYISFTPPVVENIFDIEKITKEKENYNNVIDANSLMNRLEKLKPGNDRGQASEYEKLCVEIITYLFESEFTKMAEQNSTEDRMFKMDLVCGLKGTSEFWNIFIKHYNTRFVVFEFKNYEDEVDQNLIYITEKYLYNAVLRNVAIIISRKGFSSNARKAATGILTECGKLIIDIKDSDVIAMLNMKADGQDASDYMLNILEDYLMSISK